MTSTGAENVFAGLVSAVPLVHGAVRQLRRGRGRGAGQGAGRHPAQDPRGDRGPQAAPDGAHRGRASAPSCDVGDLVRRRPPARSSPSDGDVVEGIASVDESAITGESAPVIRESGGDRSAVTGGTRVLSDEIVVRITAKPGRDLPRPDDRPRRGRRPARRRRTRSPSASCWPGSRSSSCWPSVTLQPFAIYAGAEQSIIVLVALLVCLIPTTIGGLLSAIGIAGMDRLVQRNVLAMSGRAVEAAGDCATLLLDKTGTITFGNRQAAEFVAGDGVDRRRAGRGRAALEPGRRDARGAVDRGAGQGALRPARAGRAPAPTLVAFTAADPHERRRLRTAARSARAPPTRCAAGSRSWAARSRPRSATIVDAHRLAGRHAARGRRGRRGGSPPPGPSASSTSRTS